MFTFSEEIFSDIEKTLDQLMQNAEAIKTACINGHLAEEIEALHKTQESLLARLIHRQSMINSSQKQKALETIRKETLEKQIAEYGKKGALFLLFFKRSARIRKKRKVFIGRNLKRS